MSEEDPTRPPPAGTKSIVFAPHPDDEVLGCGGSVSKLIQAGSQVSIVYLTSGELGVSGATGGSLREDEAKLATACLGVDEIAFLRIPDGQINDRDLTQVETIISLIRQQRPALVYVPHARESSHDHRVAFRLLWRALSMSGSHNYSHCGEPWWVGTILGYEVSSPMSTVQYYEDITEHLDQRQAALLCYTSQARSPRGGQADYIGARGASMAAYRGSVTTGGFREAFQVLRLAELPR